MGRGVDDIRGNVNIPVLGTCVTKDSHSKIQLEGQKGYHHPMLCPHQHDRHRRQSTFLRANPISHWQSSSKRHENPDGDLNVKVGTDNTNRDLIMGRHGTGEQNENGELFAEFCTFNDLAIGSILFPHKTIHKTTWTSPDGKTENQIDHITIGRKWRRSLRDVRVKRGADAASAELKTKLKAYNDQAGWPSHKFNVQCLKEKQKSEEFKLNWGTSSVCFPYSQKKQLKNSGTVCERPGRRHAQQPWAERRGSTKSGLHLTPGHLSPRGRTLKTESTKL